MAAPGGSWAGDGSGLYIERRRAAGNAHPHRSKISGFTHKGYQNIIRGVSERESVTPEHHKKEDGKMVEMIVKAATPIEIALSIDEEGYTTARKLYEWLELDAAHYSRWVRVNLLENAFAEEGKDYSPLRVSKSGRGNFAEDYRISVTFAKRLSMMSKTERGEDARKYFLGCEQALVRLVEQARKTELERAKGIAVRQALTKAIQQSNENDRMHGHAYSVYTDVVYKAVFGKTAKKMKEEYGLTPKDSLRDHLSEEELRSVQAAEMLVSSLVEYGWGYDEIKDFVMNKVQKKIA